MLDPSPSITLSKVPCPFCSLLCDDLVITNQDGQLHIEKYGCVRAVAGFERPVIPSSPRVRSTATTLEEAINTTVALLREAHQPLYAGLGTDVAGIRAVLALADRTGGVVDHMYSEGAMRNFLALQARGWMTTTLAEVKNRADLLLFAGTDVVRDCPRFFERVVWNEHSLFNLVPSERSVIYLGRGLDTTAGETPKGHKPLHIPCEIDQLGEIALVIRALLAGQILQSAMVAGVKIGELQALAERMKQARYGVMVWSPGQFNFPHADLIIQSLCDLVKDLNQFTRFAGLTAAGSGGDISAGSVCAWQAGFPLRTSFGSGYPAYDPWRYSTQRLVAREEADAVVWISSFHPESPPVTKIPTVVIGLPQLQLKQEPEVFIPVATPGVDHTGQLVRCDNVVSLPLRQVRTSPLPTVAGVLNAIQHAL